MIEHSKDTIPLDENIVSSVLTVSNKKFISDPVQERRALAELLGQQQLITEDTNEQ